MRSIFFNRCVILGLVFPVTVFSQDVEYERYQLPNGMNVILHQDNSLPVATINLWYYVGSKDEVRGRSGFAHLFEHLMFMGTERVPGGDFDTIMENGGGWNNATTSEDRTNYFSYGPSNLLTTLLWLDADRLQDLGKNMTQEKLDKQRDVVRNERRQSYENQPYGKSELMVYELMFPEGHPYHIPVIGTHEDLEAATVEDVKNFFATYYVPCNASLVVAGDFKPDEIKPIIERIFGTLPRGSNPVHREAEPVKLSKVIRHTMSDAVQFNKTTLVYHSPAAYHPGDAEMDLTAAVLSSGISSRLYQKLVYDNPLAIDVSVAQSSMLLGSLFYVEATARPGVELDVIEKAIDEVLSEYVAQGPSTEELERHKANIEYAMVSRLESLMTKTDMLNHYQFYFQEPNSFKRDLDRYRTATPAAVREWASKVLTPDARLILRVISEIEPMAPDPRDEKPALAENKAFVPPIPEIYKLSNGIEVYQWQRHELPLVSMSVLVFGGSELDGQERMGLASLTADMLDEGAGQLGAIEFENALDQLGADLTSAANHESIEINLSVLSRNFDKAVGLLADAAQRPRFDQKEWDRVQALRIEELKQEQDDPVTVAGLVGMRTFFGDDHPYGRPIYGTPESVAKLNREQAMAFHNQLFQPQQVTILIAGDLSSDQAKQYLESAFGTWQPKPGENLPKPDYPKPANEKLRTVVVDRPDAVQTVIRFYMPAPAFSTPNRTRVQLLNTILGGGFTSRLNQNLRERNGYTYGARSGYSLKANVGYMIAVANVRADVTGASLKEFLNEFAAIRKGSVTSDEAGKARAAYRTDLVESFSQLNGILDRAVDLLVLGQPLTTLADDLKSVESITNSELNRLANDAIPLEQGLLVLVGDKAEIMKQYEGLGLPVPMELTVTGDLKP